MASQDPSGAAPSTLLTRPRSRLWKWTRRQPRAISLASVALLIFAIVLVFALSPGAQSFGHFFLSPHYLRLAFFGDESQSVPPMWQAFLKNVGLCLVAEVLVLLWALPVALLRMSKSALLAGPRLLATAYVDLARGLPLILVVLAVYFGFPQLEIPFVSSRTWFEYGLFCLVFCYGAYVSEVYRAGVAAVPFAQTLAGKAIGVEARTAHEAWLRDFFPGSDIRPYETAAALRAALRRGEVEAIFGDGVTLALWLNGTDAAGCCAFRGGPFLHSAYFGEGVGVAVRKNNSTLRRAIDFALARIAGRGVYADLYLKYFPVGFF